MRTKGGADCTSWYPEVVEQLAAIGGGPHVIDGEACVIDSHGRSDFWRLKERASRRRWVAGAQVTLMAFDIMVHQGRSVMQLPLVERRALLESVLARVPPRTVLFVKDLPADAVLFHQFVIGLQLEGFMAKRKSSPYRPGERSDDWRKVKRKGAVEAQRFKRA